ncbi:MAG: hypothetical protein ACTSRW_01170 [Candidatus Helarchaeota archaeon]
MTDNDTQDIDYDAEIEEFPKKVKTYLWFRCIAIYVAVIVGTYLLSILTLSTINLVINGIITVLVPPPWDFPPRIVQHIVNFWALIIVIPVSIIGMNLFLQWWSRFYPIPYVLLDRVQRAGFILKRPRLLFFFRRTRVCLPKKDSYFKVGVRVRYFPFMELKYGCKITIISKALCDVNDSVLFNLVKKIAEKNFISFEHEKEVRKEDGRIKIRKKKGMVRFKAVCNPEEAISQMMQMGKAIREFEDAKIRLVEMALGNGQI